MTDYESIARDIERRLCDAVKECGVAEVIAYAADPEAEITEFVRLLRRWTECGG